MRVFAFAFVTEALLLYALRSKTKPIFLNHVRNFQNQDLELTQIFSRSIKKFSLSMLIPIARLWNHYRAVSVTESSIVRKPFCFKPENWGSKIGDQVLQTSIYLFSLVIFAWLQDLIPILSFRQPIGVAPFRS